MDGRLFCYESLTQNESLLGVYSIQKIILYSISRFPFNASVVREIDVKGKVVTFQVIKVDESKLLFVIHYDTVIDYFWLGSNVPDQEITMNKLKDADHAHFLTYMKASRQIMIFQNFNVAISDKIDFSSVNPTVSISNKKVTVTTDLGPINNLIDTDSESIASVQTAKNGEILFITSACKIFLFLISFLF